MRPIQRTNVRCPNCDEDTGVTFNWEPAEPATWGYAGGSPPYPETIGVDDDQPCEHCDHVPTDLEREAQEDEIRDTQRQERRGRMYEY